MRNFIIGIFPVSSTHLWHNQFSWPCIQTFLTLLFLFRFVKDGVNTGFRQKRWSALMRTTALLNKVDDMLAATAPEHVVCQLCDEVIQGRVQFAQRSRTRSTSKPFSLYFVNAFAQSDLTKTWLEIKTGMEGLLFS